MRLFLAMLMILATMDLPMGAFDVSEPSLITSERSQLQEERNITVPGGEGQIWEKTVKTDEGPLKIDEETIIIIEDSIVSDQAVNETKEFKLYPRGDGNPYKFKAKDLIAPGVLLTVGGIGLTHWWKKHINEPVKDALWGDRHKTVPIDNYLLWVPAAAGYGMNLFGFKGRHDVADATIIFATAYILLEASTFAIKIPVHSPRPNLKNNNSFPSGHTAIAFCGAELLRREYWHVSPWIGIGGYAVAACTGFMRLYNNAHWLNDVIAGAGLGILCAEAAYWLYPVITKAFFKKRCKANIYLAPSVSTTDVGMACAINF